MNRMRLFALTAVLLTLAGCATRERYESELQTWVGKNISAVMDAWGYPSGSFEALVSLEASIGSNRPAWRAADNRPGCA